MIVSDVFEIVWESGHIENLMASQVSWPTHGLDPWSLQPSRDEQRVNFHDTIDGKWTLVLSAKRNDIRTIRNLTRAPGGTDNLEDKLDG